MVVQPKILLTAPLTVFEEFANKYYGLSDVEGGYYVMLLLFFIFVEVKTIIQIFSFWYYMRIAFLLLKIIEFNPTPGLKHSAPLIQNKCNY